MVNLNFHRLTISDRDSYTECFRTCPEQSSDYSFINLFAWDHARHYDIAFDSGLCWLRVNNPAVSHWSPVGSWIERDWEKILSEIFPEGIVIERVPENLALQLKGLLGERVSLQEERSEWEYIYNVKELIELKGNRLHKKKNLLNQFKSNFEWIYRHVDLPDVRMILKMQKIWCEWKNCDGSTGLKAEHDAIKKVLEYWEDLPGLIGGTLFVGDQMVAYTIGEPLDKETVIIHFEKGLGDYKGVYQAINQLFLEGSASRFQWVNREQDMGNEGLRKAKMSYEPHHFLKKYLLYWKP